MDPSTKPAQIRALPVAYIRPSPYQARRAFSDDALQSLATSMRLEGLIQPITVRAMLDERRASADDSVSITSVLTTRAVPQYELISGERRLRAAKLLNWETIEARVIDVVSEGEAAVKGLVENLQRQDLDPIEEAEGFSRLNRVDPLYWTQEKIAEVSGKNRTYISRALTLLTLPETVQADMRRGLLSRNHGIELCRLPTPELQHRLAAAIRGRLSVQETRRRINHMLLPPSAPTLSVRALPPAPSAVPDPLALLWDNFLKNPWLGAADSCRVTYLGKNRWSFEVTLPTATPAPFSVDARVELARSLGDRLARLSRSLRLVRREALSPPEELPD